MKKLMVLASLLFATASLSACSTVEGMGEDLSKASRAVESSM